MEWREAMNGSEFQFVTTPDDEGFPYGIINGLPDGRFLVECRESDAQIRVQSDAGVDLALEELNLDKNRKWS